MKKNLARIVAGAGATVAALALASSPASAHVGTSADEVASGSSLALGLTIGHGCEDSPTTKVAVQIPEGVNNASAFAHPGWTISYEKATLSPPVTSAHGQELTERTATITFTATPGNELPTDVRDTFTINFTAPDTPGETLFFKTIQSCTTGSNDWIAEWDGEGEEPDSPAPSVAVTESTGDDGHGAVTTAPTTNDDSSDGLAIAGIVVGGLGLATGGVALSRTRKAS
jgi:uncharacterized protein YcnI